MNIELLVAEIGSTTTVLNAFSLENAEFLGQGQAPTSVMNGDVRIGIKQAMQNLADKLNTDELKYKELLATSSAAGGLKMSVHGLVYDMTVKAAKEAALGAGGIIKKITAGKLRRTDIADLKELSPNLILLAGGTDYGERDTAIHNAELLARSGIDAPLIYAGNIENRREIELIFREECGRDIYIADNVYPKLDKLNIEPTRKIIHEVFERHITGAPGMEHVRDMVTGSIIPTPGAVMECALLLYQSIGDLVVFDVGGATTDVHSVTDGSEEIQSISISPEPKAKRTVEGDLGVFVNAPNIIETEGADLLSQRLGIDVTATMDGYFAIPKTPEEFTLVTELTRIASCTALERHAGQLRHVYTPSGRKTVAEGKDLTRVSTFVATGGALTRLPNRQTLMETLRDYNKTGMSLLPKPGMAKILYDEHYIMASLGVMARHYPAAALKLLQKSLNI